MNRREIEEQVWGRVQVALGTSTEERVAPRVEEQISGRVSNLVFDVVRMGVLRLVWSRTGAYVWDQSRRETLR